ncbi:MAG: hypothetical protein U1E35_03140 [Rhodospirillales bacterium]
MHTLEDAEPGHPLLAEAQRLMLCAETSCYWYWTGQHVWDQQVTNAANLGWSRIRPSIEGLLAAGRDATPPTICSSVTPRTPAARSGAGAAGRMRRARAPCTPSSPTSPASPMSPW